LIEAWRIVAEKHAAEAMKGEGAKRFGGRWNSPGTPLIYAASSRSLAMLEILVHIDPVIPYLFFPIRFHESLVETMSLSMLSDGWDTEPPNVISKSIGDAWIAAASSPVLSVPSVIVPKETNYLLNPAHLQFAMIEVGSPEACRFDSRLISR
jgi:RES domain-containing protein